MTTKIQLIADIESLRDAYHRLINECSALHEEKFALQDLLSRARDTMHECGLRDEIDEYLNNPAADLATGGLTSRSIVIIILPYQPPTET